MEAAALSNCCVCCCVNLPPRFERLDMVDEALQVSISRRRLIGLDIGEHSLQFGVSGWFVFHQPD